MLLLQLLLYLAVLLLLLLIVAQQQLMMGPISRQATAVRNKRCGARVQINKIRRIIGQLR